MSSTSRLPSCAREKLPYSPCRAFTPSARLAVAGALDGRVSALHGDPKLSPSLLRADQTLALRARRRCRRSPKDVAVTRPPPSVAGDPFSSSVPLL